MTVDKLKNLTLLITDGKHGDCKNADNSGYYFVSCKDVHDGIIDYSDARQITEQDFADTHRRTQLQPDDILVTNSGTIGRMALVKDAPETARTTFQKSVAIVKPDTKKIIPAYLYYCLLNRVTDFVNNSNGSAQKNLLLGTMRDFSIQYYEEVEKQETVVSIIKPYDDLIETNQRQIKLLEEAAQRLYKEWFVDLRYPGYENVPVVDGVPEGWKKTRFSDRVDVLSGGTPKTSNPEYYNGTIPFYSPKDSDDRFFAFDTETHITDSGLKNCNSKLYPEGTIIITARGTVGKTTILAKPMAMNQSCYALRSNQVSSVYYLFFALRQEILALKTMANGGVFDTIIVKTFDRINLMTPSDSLIQEFDKQVLPVMERLKALMIEIKDLSEARDRLLPKLMSGEIAV